MRAAFRLHGVTEIWRNRVKQSSEHESFQMFRFASAERTTWNEYFANCVMDNPIICTITCRFASICEAVDSFPFTEQVMVTS